MENFPRKRSRKIWIDRASQEGDRTWMITHRQKNYAGETAWPKTRLIGKSRIEIQRVQIHDCDVGCPSPREIRRHASSRPNGLGRRFYASHTTLQSGSNAMDKQAALGFEVSNGAGTRWSVTDLLSTIHVWRSRQSEVDNPHQSIESAILKDLNAISRDVRPG